MKERHVFFVRWIALCCCCLFVGTSAFAQQARKEKPDDERTIALPVIYYTPETNLVLGASALKFFRLKGDSATSRVSQVQILAAYTLNRQIIFSTPFNVFAKNELYWFSGQLEFFRYPYIFNGIGNNVPTGYAEDYTAQFPRVRFTALRRLKPRLYGGVQTQFQYTSISDTPDSVSTNEGWVPAGLGTGAILGSEGGRVAGIGLALNYDSRDDLFFPTRGIFLQNSTMHHSSLTGSEFAFDQYLFDWRAYLPIANEHVLAAQLFTEFNNGQTPFNRMAQVGGPNRMRGYFRGQYRDRKLVSTQVEYRSPMFYSMRLTAFLAYGGVASRLNELAVENMRFTYGAGWRWRMNPQNNLHFRFDLGFTEDGDQELYFTLGEAF